MESLLRQSWTCEKLCDSCDEINNVVPQQVKTKTGGVNQIGFYILKTVK